MGRARGRMLAWQISVGTRVNSLKSPWAMLLYTWLIPHADNLGRQEGEPEQVKWRVFPKRPDVTVEMVERWLVDINTAKLIIWYRVDGMKYLQFPETDWTKHQILKANNSRKSEFPPCPDSVRTAFERCIHAVSPEVEVELEVEVEGEIEIEGEVEVRQGESNPSLIERKSEPERPFQIGDRVKLVEKPEYRGKISGREGKRWGVFFDEVIPSLGRYHVFSPDQLEFA